MKNVGANALNSKGTILINKYPVNLLLKNLFEQPSWMTKHSFSKKKCAKYGKKFAESKTSPTVLTHSPNLNTQQLSP